MNLELRARVLDWAHGKGILTEGTPAAQVAKTLEEVSELQDEILDIDLGVAGAEQKAMMERGDITVTLIILDYLLNFDEEECLELALAKIENRNGEMRDGQFIKEEDL